MKIKDTFDCVYDLGNRLWKHAGAPDMTKDPQMRRYLMAHSKLDCRSPEFLRLQDNFYKPKGYQPGQSENYLKMNIGRMMARQYKVTTYIDHYLNTITYHYVTYMPSGVTVLARITETGYIFQRREMLEQEIAGSMPPEINNFIETLKNIFDKQKAQSEKELQQAEEKNKKESNDKKEFKQLLQTSNFVETYNKLNYIESKIIEITQEIENFSDSNQYTLNKFLKQTHRNIQLETLMKERDGLVRDILVYTTKLRKNVQNWEQRHATCSGAIDWVIDKIGYAVELVGDIELAKKLCNKTPIGGLATR